MSKLDRFLNKIQEDPQTGCWLWTASRNRNGYGHFYPVGNKHIFAHRWSYEFFVGPLSPDLDVDHLCNVRCCANPTHLRLCSHQENIFAAHSNAPPKQNRAKESCIAGHEFSGVNLITWFNSHREGRATRTCRICKNRRNREYKLRKRGACGIS